MSCSAAAVALRGVTCDDGDGGYVFHLLAPCQARQFIVAPERRCWHIVVCGTAPILGPLADDEAIEELKWCLWNWKRSGTNEAASTQASSWMFHNTAAAPATQKVRSTRLAGCVCCLRARVDWRDQLLEFSTGQAAAAG